MVALSPFRVGMVIDKRGRISPYPARPGVTFRGTDTTFAGGWYGVWLDDDFLKGPLSLDAVKNQWRTAAGTVTTDSATIASMIKIDSTATGAVDHSYPLSSLIGQQNCPAAGARMLARRGQEVADEATGAGGQVQAAPRVGLPTEFALHASFPNPVRSRAEIGYDVPAGYGAMSR
jgi:hypothetical protein